MSLNVGTLEAVLELDRDPFERGLRQIGPEFRQATRRMAKDAESDGDDVGKRLGAGVLGSFSSTLMAGAKKVAAVAAAGFAGEFLVVAGKALVSGVAKLVHGIGAVAALAPAAALAGAAAVGSLKVALSGFGDAISAGLTGDTEAFNEALEDMSPSARLVARDIAGLRDKLKGLKQTVQESLFEPLTESVKPLAAIYLPMVESTLSGIARTFGQVGNSVGNFFELPSVSTKVASTLRNVKEAVTNVVVAAGNLPRAFLPLFTVGSEFLPQLSDGLSGVTQRFAMFMEEAERSGRLREFIQGGIDKLGELRDSVEQAVRIVSNFVGGIRDLFSEAAMPTHGVADGLERMSEQFEAWAGSAAAQERVRRLVEFLSNVDWGQVAQVAAALSAMSLAFKTFSGVGGLVQGISALAALGPVGLVILGVAAALALLVGGLVFAYKESESFRAFVNDQVVPALKELWHWFEEELLPALEKVGAFIGNEMSRVWGFFTETVKRNWPELQKVGNLLREIAEVVGPPLIMMLGAVALGWMGVVIAMAIVVETIGILVRAFESAKNWISDNWPALFGILTGPISAAVLFIVANIQGVPRAFQAAKDWVVRTLNDLVNFLAELPGRVTEALRGLWDGLTPPSIGDVLGGVTSQLPGVGGGRITFPTRPAKGGFRMHTGGHLPGGANTEFLRILQGGEDVLARNDPLNSRNLRGRAVAQSVDATLRVIIDVLGGESQLGHMLREWIRIEAGGNVQAALGQGEAA